jgi:uncharacterized protein (UPF0548 family)
MRKIFTRRGGTRVDGEALLNRMRAAELTYKEVGGTEGSAPAGYHVGTYRRVVGQGRADFDRAALGLRTWQPQRSIGVQPFAEARLLGGETLLFVMPAGPAEIRICCRVVSVVETETQFGFTYGTLPCHPEIGEERFGVTLEPNGEVVFAINVFWRSGTLISTLGGPVTSFLQRRATRGYLDGLEAWVAAGSGR